MSNLVARIASFTCVPALIALISVGGATLGAIEPQDIPAKPAVQTATIGDAATKSEKTEGKHHKGHKHHRKGIHKGADGRKAS